MLRMFLSSKIGDQTLKTKGTLFSDPDAHISRLTYHCRTGAERRQFHVLRDGKWSPRCDAENAEARAISQEYVFYTRLQLHARTDVHVLVHKHEHEHERAHAYAHAHAHAPRPPCGSSQPIVLRMSIHTYLYRTYTKYR